MGLKDIFKSIFRRSDTTAESLDEAIWHSCLQVADSVIKRGDAAADHRLHIAVAFACGLVHMADRIAFEVIRERRAQVMDKLMVGVTLRASELAVVSGIPKEEKERLMGVMLDEMNEALQFYGQFKKVSAEGDESPKGTLLWEFGKRYAEAANHSMDIAFVMYGAGMLIEMAKAIRMRELVLLS